MANKRVIDLAELSQTVQEGQYILVDSAGGTGKMNLKQIVDDIAIDPEGVYPDLIAGDLATDKHQTDTTPYLFRPSASVGERAYETIVGASVWWNQLVQSGATSVTVQSGHKYYAKINGTESIGASTGSAITINDSSKDMVTDLTAELGSTIADYIYSLESATAGSGIAKLRSWGFLRGYQAYNAGAIESVEVTDKVVRGFNAWDEETRNGYYNTNGVFVQNSGYLACKNLIPVLPNTAYCIACANKNIGRLCFYDSDESFVSTVTATSSVAVYTFTTPSNCYYMAFDMTGSYGTTYNHDICINLSSDRNGEYEPYHSASYPLGSDVLRGIFKLDNGKLYADGDVKTSDGVITRHYGTRAYQSGDESLPDAITDGTTTVYKLTTPTTEQSTPFTSPQTVYPDGTEEFVTENGVPVGHSTDYPYSIKALAEELIDIPDVPSANGTYVLKATRSASGIVYNWVTG